MNLVEFLHKAKIEDLDLPAPIFQKLREQKLVEFQKIYACVQSYRAFRKCSIEGVTDEEMQVLNQKCTDLMVANGLMKPPLKPVTAPSKTAVQPSTPAAHNLKTTGPVTTLPRRISEVKRPSNEETIQPVKPITPSEGPLALPPSPLSVWESQLAPRLKKVELIGEISISKEELDDISRHFSRLFYNRNPDEMLILIERNFPVTFLVFMVGQGIFGYYSGDFWPAYERALNRSIENGDFGRLFEKLLARFGKPRFPDLQERAFRYVSLILAHGGIPVYCLKDFFNNIVLNCSVHPQLLALEGEELVEEVLKHSSYTFNTDKPVLYFLEYGGKTAANLLDRARKMLLTWQESQTILSADEAGLPFHVIQYFEEWTHENSELLVERGPRNRLKRPQLSLDPWGLGIFLELPSQPISAFSVSDINWKVDAGDYHQIIKARTQRKGEQLETREVTFRLNSVSDIIQVQFSQGDKQYEWKITGYSPDHLILAFDPSTGHIQTHILAREIWLLYPKNYSLSILKGEGMLVEVLPELPGEWSKFKLECWDLSQTICLGLIKNKEVFREIYVRSHEKVEKPSLEGGTIIPTDLEEDPIPLYAGAPPALHIPLGYSEDIYFELERWQIKIENVDTASPEIFIQKILADLTEEECEVVGNKVMIHLSAPTLLTGKPAGTYQIAIKGPLGRDAALCFRILPIFEISGLKARDIPDFHRGLEAVSFSIRTSLKTGIDCLNGADGIKVDTNKSGLHRISVPSELSSVGLLIRSETIRHQFIRMPIHFRINRLRWRMVEGNGQVGSWLQKHFSLSLQKFLQEESPILIVDLPGNQNGDLNLYINLLDIQGRVIQKLNPADRSTKHINRFWRFDLSQIKHSMEMSDGPIFRADLVGINTAKESEKFILPVLVFTREIQVTGVKTEVYSSLDQYHILATWKEKEKLRSRALILWSLFHPWQPPIVENIPDSANGEYEFSISRKDHAEGVYRMQMVVVDPWVPTPSTPYPPTLNEAVCYDVVLSSPTERLETLEKGIAEAASHRKILFSDCIEISLIRQYLGEMLMSIRDLEVCCRNLLPASSREILTLASILCLSKSEELNNQFGNQIILPEVMNRLYQDMLAGSITLQEIISILEYAPHSKNWPIKTCEILLQLEYPKVRFRALIQLVNNDVSKAVVWIVKLVDQSKLSLEDAVDLLFEEKIAASDQLKKIVNNPSAEKIINLLQKYNPYSGLPLVQPGSWAFTNAGWGRIDEILDPRTRISVDSFIQGDGKYVLLMTMHIDESHDFTGEKAIINISTGEITFPRANRIFICQHCQEFVTTKVEIYKKHLFSMHGNALPCAGEHGNIVRLTNIHFDITPQHKKREI